MNRTDADTTTSGNADPDAYVVITPYGVLRIIFFEDRPNIVKGPDDAQLYFGDCLRIITGRRGRTKSLNTLDPGHLMGFCDRKDMGLFPLEPVDVICARIARQVMEKNSKS